MENPEKRKNEKSRKKIFQKYSFADQNILKNLKIWKNSEKSGIRMKNPIRKPATCIKTDKRNIDA